MADFIGGMAGDFHLKLTGMLIRADCGSRSTLPHGCSSRKYAHVTPLFATGTGCVVHIGLIDVGVTSDRRRVTWLTNSLHACVCDIASWRRLSYFGQGELGRRGKMSPSVISAPMTQETKFQRLPHIFGSQELNGNIPDSDRC